MENNFEITFFSDSRYEELTIEIHYKDQILCQINKDKGIDEMEIEFFQNMRILSETVNMKFSLNDFVNVIKKAKNELANS